MRKPCQVRAAPARHPPGLPRAGVLARDVRLGEHGKPTTMRKAVGVQRAAKSAATSSSEYAQLAQDETKEPRAALIRIRRLVEEKGTDADEAMLFRVARAWAISASSVA